MDILLLIAEILGKVILVLIFLFVIGFAVIRPVAESHPPKRKVDDELYELKSKYKELEWEYEREIKKLERQMLELTAEKQSLELRLKHLQKEVTEYEIKEKKYFNNYEVIEQNQYIREVYRERYEEEQRLIEFERKNVISFGREFAAAAKNSEVFKYDYFRKGLEVGSFLRAYSLDKPTLSLKSISKFDVQVKIATTSGQGEYTTSLTECTCNDFKFNRKRQTPCKHMMYLAFSLGVLQQKTLDERVFEKQIGMLKKEADQKKQRATDTKK